MIEYSNSINQTIYAIFVASFMPIFFSILAKVLGKFSLEDNKNPRDFLANTTGMAKRAHAVHINSFEVLPFYLVSLLIAIYMVVPQHIINQLAWTFIFCRILYAVAYLLDRHIMRSALWFLAIGCPVMLLRICLNI